MMKAMSLKYRFYMSTPQDEVLLVKLLHNFVAKLLDFRRNNAVSGSDERRSVRLSGGATSWRWWRSIVYRSHGSGSKSSDTILECDSHRERMSETENRILCFD